MQIISLRDNLTRGGKVVAVLIGTIRSLQPCQDDMFGHNLVYSSTFSYRYLLYFS